MGVAGHVGGENTKGRRGRVLVSDSRGPGLIHARRGDRASSRSSPLAAGARRRRPVDPSLPAGSRPRKVWIWYFGYTGMTPPRPRARPRTLAPGTC